MLSILIPNYNFVPNQLLHKLNEELNQLNIPEIEIMFWDDCSPKSVVSELEFVGELNWIKSKFLAHNLGRAGIRNAMAEAASQAHILFIDSDGLPTSDHFVKNYLEAISKALVVVGGRVYEQTPPEDADLLLHWKYGTERECKTAEIRNSQPYFGFQSNNFLIKKSIFLSLAFDKNFNSYGHEDSVFGMELKRKEIPVVHIDNPTCHIGVEGRATFLKKSIEAVVQLAAFIENGKLNMEDTRLSAAYNKLSKNGGLTLFSWIAARSKSSWERHLLKAKRPKLKILDAYKLWYFIEQQKAN